MLKTMLAAAFGLVASGSFGGGDYSRGELRRSLGLDADQFLLGTVASLTAPKNHAANLAMWGAARAQRLDAQFLLCSEGRMRGELEGTPARLGITETFRFLGNQRPVHPWVPAMDSFVLWSTWEGQELALFACGLPVLASRIEGNVAVLGADHPGLFNLCQPEDYVSKVLAFRRDAAFRRATPGFQETRSPAVPSVRREAGGALPTHDRAPGAGHGASTRRRLASLHRPHRLTSPASHFRRQMRSPVPGPDGAARAGRCGWVRIWFARAWLRPAELVPRMHASVNILRA